MLGTGLEPLATGRCVPGNDFYEKNFWGRGSSHLCPRGWTDCGIKNLLKSWGRVMVMAAAVAIEGFHVIDDQARFTIGADLARLYLSEYCHHRYGTCQRLLGVCCLTIT